MAASEFESVNTSFGSSISSWEGSGASEMISEAGVTLITALMLPVSDSVLFSLTEFTSAIGYYSRLFYSSLYSLLRLLMGFY